MPDNATFGVALVGCGTVGGALARLLTGDARIVAERSGARIALRHIVDVDFANARRQGLDESLFEPSLEAALADPQVHAVVELIGGVTVARRTVESALRAGRHVVTANKALLAQAGPELCALARSKGVAIAFEASCAGGIPIIRALYDGLIANRIDAIYGIVNGTCNYILSSMTEFNRDYAAALGEAQAAGLAEADPTLDVSGADSAHKLAILASLAFGARVDFAGIPASGIDKLDLRDLRYGQELGYVIKLLAIGQRTAEGLSLRVRPVFISRQHPLAWVSGPFNAVSVYGHATGHTMYYGRGAGGAPTASAVAADLVGLACGTLPRAFERLALWSDRTPQALQLPVEAVRSRYYIRVQAKDAPGVLARIAAIFGRHEISIASVLQHEPAADGSDVPVVITTHAAREGEVRQALVEVDAMEVIKGPSVCIGIVDEHPNG